MMIIIIIIIMIKVPVKSGHVQLYQMMNEWSKKKQQFYIYIYAIKMTIVSEG